MIGIYMITSPTGGVYIGQSWNIYERLKDYYNPINVKRQQRIYNSLMKYGVNKHTFYIIHILPSNSLQEDLDKYEILYWQFYKDCGFKILNIKEPGKSGKMSEESKIKIGNANRGKKYVGRPCSEETKRKISEANKGRKLSKEHIEMLKSINKGRKRSEQMKLTLKSYHKRPIVVLDLSGKFLYEFDYISDAAKFLNLSQPNYINLVLKGKKKTCKNYQFILKSEYDSKKDYRIGKGDCRSICRYDLNGNFIKDYMSVMDAERELKIKYANTNIIACCKGKYKKAYGSIWKYKSKL